jgi:hypothetical protein
MIEVMDRGNPWIGLVAAALALGASGCPGLAVTPRVPAASVAAPAAGPRDIHPGVLRGLLVAGELTVATEAAGFTRTTVGDDDAAALVRVATVREIIVPMRVCIDTAGLPVIAPVHLPAAVTRLRGCYGQASAGSTHGDAERNGFARLFPGR